LSRKRYSLRDIARALKRSVSTISEERSRNKTQDIYDSRKANHKAYVRRKYAKFQGMKIVDDTHLQKFVEEKLYDDQLPRAISGRLKHQEKKLTYVSKNSICRYIKSVYGRQVEYYRKQRQQKRRRKRIKKTHLSDRKSIEKRPKHIEKRYRCGDVEADFVESGKNGTGILLVVEDRKTRSTFLEQICTVTILRVHSAFVRIQNRFPEMKTITTDNDILFQKHKELEKLLNVKIYFCHPYHSWEKGSVENTNKCIRRDIPKGSNISSYSRSFIEKLEQKLNRRMMECLYYRTPSEVLQEVRKRRLKRRG